MTLLPHFAHPVAFADQPDGTLALAVVEQDSFDDIVACLARIASYTVGSRDELPEFGITQLAFQQTGPLRAQLERWEPRADLSIREFADAVQRTLREVRVGVAPGA
jgi:phage host-nuclease inhibitor protein Gam